MLENNHGIFDNVKCDVKIDSYHNIEDILNKFNLT